MKALIVAIALAATISQPALYGLEKPLFDKTWKLPDIEQVN